MDKYLVDNFVGKYRVKAEIDLETCDFPREKNGTINNTFSDFYIDCQNGIKVFHFGGDVLQIYFPSLNRGNNRIKALRLDGYDDLIFDIERTDKELLFKCKAEDFEIVKKYVKPKTYGASISPLSVRNLPKVKYTIPFHEMQLYKEIIAPYTEDNTLSISHATNRFIKDVVSKGHKLADVKADMKRQKLVRDKKAYIHKIGMWNEYLEYLEDNLSVSNEKRY